MRVPIWLGIAAIAGMPSCTPGGPIYFGPPLAALEGRVYSYEDQVPIPYAEVCVFSTDTMCVRGDKEGFYKAQLTAEQVGPEGTVTVRFRVRGLSPVSTNLTEVRTGETRKVNCGISNRLAFGSETATCLPTPDGSPDG